MPQNKIVESSVQVENQNEYWQNTIFRIASSYDAIPEWWSRDRDAWFRKYWYQEPFLASAIYAIANRNAAFSWELTGITEDVQYAQQLLQFADFGMGWQQFITKFSTDYETQDNGAFIEIIRPAKVKVDGKTLLAIKEFYENNKAEWFALDNGKRISLRNKSYSIYDSPLDLPIGIAHLDSGQCQRTGNFDVPVIYTDRAGKRHRLKWWQVLTFNEMPSPIEKMNGVGYSALTRVFRASHIMQSLSIYNDEKLGGRFNRAIHLTNIDAEVINDAIAMSNNEADNRGLIRYSQPIIAQTLKPDAAVSLETIDLASVPDGFDMNTMQNWYIANLALALGVDFGFLAPLPGKGLGTASQSETMAKQSKGKSSRLFMDAVANAINFKGVLPQSVQFNFVEQDSEEEKRLEDQKKTRADRFKIYIEMGMLTPTIATQMASDAGDIPTVYVEAMGQEDITPVETVAGDTDLETVEAVRDEVEGEEKHTHQHYVVNEEYKQLAKNKLHTINYEQIQKRQAALFKKPSLAKRIQNVARQVFGKKQIETPPTIDDATKLALETYEADLNDLVALANAGEIEQNQFEELLTDLVTVSLTAFYASSVGKDPADFNAQDIANIEDELAINIESVQKVADDIYVGVYEPTEDDPTRPAMLLTRMFLWLGSAATLAWLGTIWNTANTDNVYGWVWSPEKEHCDSCIALNGQIHTAQEWREFSILPQSSELLCFGKYCGCKLQELSPNTPTRGSLTSVPLR